MKKSFDWKRQKKRKPVLTWITLYWITLYLQQEMKKVILGASDGENPKIQ